TGRRISREGGKAEGFDGRCRLDPLVVRREAPNKQRMLIRRPVVAGAKRPRQQVIMQFPPIYNNPLRLTRIL
ncbi:MAG: hypothetical protein WAV07_12680, partial [Candidatus Contendobacter sp.]